MHRIVGFGVQRGTVDGGGIVSDVQTGDSAATFAEVSQHGQRSFVSDPSMGGESLDPGSNGNQDGTPCALIASVY